MNNALQIVTILIVTVSCSGEQTSVNFEENYLEPGTFYLNYRLSNDTLKFQAKKYDQGNWNNTKWKISMDSIFHSDNRGLAKFIGKDRAAYTLKK